MKPSPALLTSFLLFAPPVLSCFGAIGMLLAFQWIFPTSAVTPTTLFTPIAAALLCTAVGLILWLIGLGRFFSLTLKHNCKSRWFWWVAVASCILAVFSSPPAVVVALPTLLFLVFKRSRFLPGQPG
jgi:hypothetical protein